MKLTLQIAAGAAIAGSIYQPAVASDTHFALRQLLIAGSTNVQATAINNRGAIVGTYRTSNSTAGFILVVVAVTVLPPTHHPCLDAYYCAAYLTAINAAGDVAGWSYPGLPVAFLWHDGAYAPDGSFTMGESGEGPSGPGLNNKGEEFFNFNSGDGLSEPYAGPPATIAQIEPPGTFPILASLNNYGVLAGSTEAFLHGMNTTLVFVGRNGKYHLLAPPGATSSSGGS